MDTTTRPAMMNTMPVTDRQAQPQAITKPLRAANVSGFPDTHPEAQRAMGQNTGSVIAAQAKTQAPPPQQMPERGWGTKPAQAGMSQPALEGRGGPLNAGTTAGATGMPAGPGMPSGQAYKPQRMDSYNPAGQFAPTGRPPMMGVSPDRR